MTTIDFTSWATPNLVLALGGHTYEVRPPSVARAAQIIACAVKTELTLGLAEGALSDDMKATLTELDDEPLGHVTLGADVYAQMVADEIPATDIDRVAYYALHYWARGKDRADAVAEWIWGEQTKAGGADPKSPVTVEEWAVYGVGEPGPEGWYPDYVLPLELRPKPVVTTGRPVMWADIVQHWGAVVADLAETFGVDLYDPAVQARPWPGVRTMIFALVSSPSRLAAALKG